MINLTDSLSACTASGILAYAKQIYHQMSGGTETNVEDLLNEHEAKIQSAIKLNEYDEVNVTRPLREGHEGYILCHLEKNNEKIIQDHPDRGSEFVDYVSGHNVYIATDMGNTNIGVLGEDEFIGYTSGEEIKNVSDSSIKSVIVDCFPSDYDYWILETETELTINNMPYYGPAQYYQTRDFTPFHLQPNGSLYLMNVGGYNGDKSIAYQAQPLQTVLEQIASASTSGGSVSVTSDEEWVNEVLPGAILVSGVTLTAKWITDTERENDVYLGFEADREVNWDLFNIDVYDYWNNEEHYNRSIIDDARVVSGCLMTELNQSETLSGNTEAISTQSICIEGKISFGYSYTIEYDESIENQMSDNGGNWWIDNYGEETEY